MKKSGMKDEGKKRGKNGEKTPFTIFKVILIFFELCFR
jgi:hypothetical protein